MAKHHIVATAIVTRPARLYFIDIESTPVSGRLSPAGMIRPQMLTSPALNLTRALSLGLHFRRQAATTSS